MDQRTLWAISIGVIGAASSGSAIGMALVRAGITDASRLLLVRLIEAARIVGTTYLTDWYMPSVQMIVTGWEEHQTLEDGGRDE